jgi:hypothetical protein
MPGPGSATYIVAAAASGNVSTFAPGTLPQPAIDGLGIVNGQYFLLTAQVNQTQNGIWFADPTGPIPIMTVATGLNPAVEISVGPGGTQNANTNWVYAAVSHNGGPGFVLI